jgi:translocation and assembly module TamB
MPTMNEPQPRQPAKPVTRFRRAIAIGLLSAVLLLAGALAGTLAWLATSESALQWSARQAEAMSNGALTLGDVHGSLIGQLRIGTIRFETEYQRIEASTVVVDWTPRALLRRHVQIDTISVETLNLRELKPTPEAPKLPESLRLPVTVSAPDVRIGRLQLDAGGSDNPPIVLSGIDLGAERHTGGFRLDLRTLAGEQGPLRGQLRADLALGETRPFDVLANAELQLAAADGNRPAYRIDAKATGNLTQLLVEATASAFGTQARVNASLAPFDAAPLVSARIAAEHVDPAQVQDGLPTADLNAEISLNRVAAGGFEGDILLRNEAPGTWEQSRLPLRELTGRFAGTPEAFDLDGLRIDLGDAGRFEGDGRFSEQNLQLALTTERFDPHGVHGKMRSMQLAGDIRLQTRAESIELVADLKDKRFRLQLDARKLGDDVELRKVIVASGSGHLDASGALALGEPGTFELAGTLAAFDPSEFGDYPAARINASFSSRGQFTPEPQAAVEFSIADSRFRERPLTGQGKLSFSAQRVWDVGTTLRLAGSRLDASGALGRPDDKLDFRLTSDDLAVIDPQIGGNVQAEGRLEGRFTALSGNVELQGGKLSWERQYRLANIQASVLMGKGFEGPLHIESAIRGLVAPGLRLDHASLNADGTRDDHTLQLSAKNATFDLRGRFAGGWQEAAGDPKGTGWRGEVRELTNRGVHPFALRSPATLEVARQRLQLNNAVLSLAGAELSVQEFSYDAGRIGSRGEFKSLPLGYLKNFADGTGDFETNLTLGGTWQFAIKDRVDGRVSLWRENGDISYRSDIEYLQEPRLTLGLDRFALDVEATNNRLQLRAEANGTQLGNLKADAQSTLSLRNGTWGIAGDAPVQGRVDLAVKTLAWLQPIIESAVSFDGAVNAQLLVGGRMAQPELTGSLAGSRFSVALLEQGVKFTDGHFQADFRDQVLRLSELTLRGGEGTLDGQGRLALENGSPALQLSLQAKKLEVLASPDRQLTLSGTSDISVAGKAVHVAAKLKADRGAIELPKADMPTLSRDVVVLGSEKSAGIKPLPYGLSFDLDLDLGDRFFVKGKGLDAQIGGALKLTGTQGGLPSSRGSIRVVKGSYAAYGQRLEIDRGFLNFQGPLDNPGLNIVAMRKNQLVEAGVSVTGTARSPQVTLVSEPWVPDGQKLSWLVLGHGTENSSAQEFSALQLAARALLGAGESVSLQQRVAQATGLDDVSLKGSGGLENTVLTLGKRLSSRAYISYEQGISSTSTLVKINYLLSQRLSLRVQAGLSPAVDMFYTFSFD